MNNILKLSALSGLLSFVSPLVSAASVDISFMSTLTFSPSADIGAGGLNAGSLLNQAFGISETAGELAISGTLTYDPDTSKALGSSLGVGGEYAGYNNPITGLTMNVSGVSIIADVNGINSSASLATSGVAGSDDNFLLLNPEVGGVSIHQVPASLNPIQSGNVALVVNDSPFSNTGPGGVIEFPDSDVFAFSLGTTSVQDFAPGFQTDAGLLTISSVFLQFSAPNSENNFLSTTDLADNLFQLINSDSYSSLLALSFELDGVPISGLDPAGEVSAVPLPASIWLFGWALTGLIGLSLRRKS